MFEYLSDMKYSEVIEGIHDAMRVLQKVAKRPPKEDVLAWRILGDIANAEQIPAPDDILERLDSDKANQYTRQLGRIADQESRRHFAPTAEDEAAAERFLERARSSPL